MTTQNKEELLKTLTEKYGDDVYTTDELTEKFIVVSFCAPFTTCVRKSDNKQVILEFTHMPRFYFNSVEVN